MSQKSSLPQVTQFVSAALMPDTDFKSDQFSAGGSDLRFQSSSAICSTLAGIFKVKQAA
jgi:hypothetical protein